MRFSCICVGACLLLLTTLSSSTTAQILSEKAQISLLTGTPGNELYSTFGHSALRVYDPELNLDIVYNYGTFDFDTPNFYLKFLRGKLDYMLSISEYKRFKVGYYYSGQSVTEQVLNLDSVGVQRVFDFLMENYKPENRYYKYDFFYDNCATRIRDLVVEIAGDSVAFDYPGQWRSDPLTFRQLLDYHLIANPWSDYGIDILLGLPADRQASPWHYMFLPEFMRIAFDHASMLKHQDWQPLIQSSEMIIEQEKQVDGTFQFTPSITNWLLFILVFSVTVAGYVTNRPFKGIDYVLFSMVGTIGWLIVFLWFFTDHLATKDNLNILWALPWHLPLVFFVLRQNRNRARRIYFIFTGALAFLLLVLWPLSPQLFHLAVIPILLLIVLRSGLHVLCSIKKHNGPACVESV